MNKLWSGVLAAGALLIALTGCTQTQPPVPFIALWNGQDLSGWQVVLAEPEQTLEWQNHQGELWLPGGIKGYIRTQQGYSDYQLSLEWRYTEKAKNGGVLLHLNGQDQVWPNSVQVQLKPQHIGDVIAMEGFYVKEAVGQEKGIVPLMATVATADPEGWITTTIIAKAGELWVYSNGIEVNHVSELERTAGYIGLQLEGVPISYRKIELQPLPAGIAPDQGL